MLGRERSPPLRCDRIWQQNSIASLCHDPTSKVLIAETSDDALPPSSDHHTVSQSRTAPPTDNIYLISRGLYFKWCKKRRRVTEGRGRDSLTEEAKAREVMREMEFAGSV